MLFVILLTIFAFYKAELTLTMLETIKQPPNTVEQDGTTENALILSIIYTLFVALDEMRLTPI